MLNYVQLSDDLRNLSDDQVRQVAVNPANPMYGTLAVAEIERRNRLRNDFQARQANPMSTVAEQLVTGAPPTPPMQAGPGAGPQGGMPAGPSAMGQAPVGTPMAGGGSVDELRGLASLMRQEELETLPGALEQARALMGEDPNVALRAMIERYRSGAGDRRRMDLTQLLARIGSGMMNSRRPDFLGAVGEGASAGVEGLDSMLERRNAEERMDITDEGALARLASDRQNQTLESGLSLYGVGRQGLGAAADIESGILNRETQLDVARLYANRSSGGGGLGGRFAGMTPAQLNTLRGQAQTALNQARAQEQNAIRTYGDPSNPVVAAANAEVRAREQELIELEMAIYGRTFQSDPTQQEDVGSFLGNLAADTANRAAPSTNAPTTRPGVRGTENELIERAIRQRGLEDQASRYADEFRGRSPDANERDGWTIERE